MILKCLVGPDAYDFATEIWFNAPTKEDATYRAKRFLKEWVIAPAKGKEGWFAQIDAEEEEFLIKEQQEFEAEIEKSKTRLIIKENEPAWETQFSPIYEELFTKETDEEIEKKAYILHSTNWDDVISGKIECPKEFDLFYDIIQGHAWGRYENPYYNINEPYYDLALLNKN